MLRFLNPFIRQVFFKKVFALLASLALIVALLPQPKALAADIPIPLLPSMVTNESGRGNAGNLVDESNNAGYPPTSDSSTNWFPGWSSSYYPASAYIDLGQNYTLSRIWFRDENGTGNVTFSAGSPGNWNFLFNDTLGGFLIWNQRSVSTTTRYLRITLSTSSTAQSLYDLVLYGRPQ